MPDSIHHMKNLVVRLEAEWKEACALLDLLSTQARAAGEKTGILCNNLRAARDAVTILERGK